MKILRSLAAVEEGQEFNGLLPSRYFKQPITYDPKWPISAKHAAIISRCGAKTGYNWLTL